MHETRLQRHRRCGRLLIHPTHQNQTITILKALNCMTADERKEIAIHLALSLKHQKQEAQPLEDEQEARILGSEQAAGSG